MSFKRPERRSLHHHLTTPSSIGQMRRNGWRVQARCVRCHLDLRVDLSVMTELRGFDFVLFGKTSRCRRMHCEGRMIFMGAPPGGDRNVFYHLAAIPPVPPADDGV